MHNKYKKMKFFETSATTAVSPILYVEYLSFGITTFTTALAIVYEIIATRRL